MQREEDERGTRCREMTRRSAPPPRSTSKPFPGGHTPADSLPVPDTTEAAPWASLIPPRSFWLSQGGLDRRGIWDA